MLKNIDNLSRQELKTILQNIGITNTNGSKKTKKIKIQNKLLQNILTKLKDDLTSTGKLDYPMSYELEQTNKFVFNGIYVYWHYDSNKISYPLSARKGGYTSTESEIRTLRSIISDRNNIIDGNPPYKIIPVYPTSRININIDEYLY